METSLNEYLLIISPDENINKELIKMKCEFRDNYGCTYAAQSHPHCTLMNFVQYQNMENYLIRRFESLVRSFSPVKITLNGFGQYPIHTIYVKMEDDKKLSKMVKIMRMKLKQVLKGFETFKTTYLTDPHLTIARRMTEGQFDQAWTEWKKRKFNSSFEATHILLLRRSISEIDFQPKGNYKEVKHFELTGAEEKEEQLALF
jgi:2'-5' RNA ligase